MLVSLILESDLADTVDLVDISDVRSSTQAIGWGFVHSLRSLGRSDSECWTSDFALGLALKGVTREIVNFGLCQNPGFFRDKSQLTGWA